jgi:hypothetical protein
MADEWDGIERRNKPHEYEFRRILREEIEPVRETQRELERKIAEWELAAKWFRVFIIGTVGLVTALVGIYEWLRVHLK